MTAPASFPGHGTRYPERPSSPWPFVSLIALGVVFAWLILVSSPTRGSGQPVSAPSGPMPNQSATDPLSTIAAVLTAPTPTATATPTPRPTATALPTPVPLSARYPVCRPDTEPGTVCWEVVGAATTPTPVPDCRGERSGACRWPGDKAANARQEIE